MKCLYEEETDMRYTLENENLKVEIDSFGAEIKSVKRKSDNFEYMWCGDKKYWGRTSPVLFPFVGAPKNKEYRYDGKTYTMGQHGFKRYGVYIRGTDGREHLICTDRYCGNL